MIRKIFDLYEFSIKATYVYDDAYPTKPHVLVLEYSTGIKCKLKFSSKDQLMKKVDEIKTQITAELLKEYEI
jgi:hypothetical protein